MARHVRELELELRTAKISIADAKCQLAESQMAASITERAVQAMTEQSISQKLEVEVAARKEAAAACTLAAAEVEVEWRIAAVRADCDVRRGKELELAERSALEVSRCSPLRVYSIPTADSHTLLPCLFTDQCVVF